ncbi:alpha/beta hydrolase [Leucobacter sp. M11]|uniref:alpha/beta hydrolase n=1 Tax=Leucobacter sp. M11 TaxID=2993565 RepID=UPI002D7E582F|nr:alpha/beta hydrolase [Leucobacter sp. M11]MEB4616006.1 alpha/beta hydrolase [Leucobacter sp. M11]
MKLSLVHPELRRGYRLMRAAPVSPPWLLRLVQWAMPRLPEGSVRPGIRREVVPAEPGGGVRVFTPSSGGNGSAVLWIHGGGMVIGAAAQDDDACQRLAERLDAVVVSAEYRLAPRHPYPAAADDCEAAWRWLLAQAPERGIDPARIALAGQSAGGGLAATLALRLRDGGGVQPAAQLLIYPMLDDRTAADRGLDAARHLLWSNRANRIGWTAYLGQAPGGDRVPEGAVPARRSDLAGLPPAWIGVGDIDLFAAEDRAFAAALSAAGVDTVFQTVPGAPHAFEVQNPRSSVARAFSGDAADWLRTRLGGEQPGLG